MSDDGGAERGPGRAVSAVGEAVAASPRQRFRAFVAVQTVAVALLASVAFRLVGVYTGLSRIDVARSGPGAALTTLVLVALVLVALALYLAIPVAVAWYVAARSDRHWLSGVFWAGVAVVGLPVLVRSLWLLVPGGGRDPRLGLLGVGGVAALVVAARRIAADRAPAETETKPPAEVFLGLLVGVAVGGAVVGGSLLFSVSGPATALVECPRCGGFVVAAPPNAEFDFDYRATGEDRGLLTVTYEGGEAVEADRLSFAGDLTDVPGTDRIQPGPWPGGGTLDVGDSVTVGVRNDPIGPPDSCEIRVLWEDEYTGVNQTVGKYECGSDGGSEPTPEPTPFPGGR